MLIFFINFRRIKETTTADISSCFLSHDCQTGIGLECIASTESSGKKRRRNYQLKREAIEERRAVLLV